jgi:hypothetical protein
MEHVAGIWTKPSYMVPSSGSHTNAICESSLGLSRTVMVFGSLIEWALREKIITGKGKGNGSYEPHDEPRGDMKGGDVNSHGDGL